MDRSSIILAKLGSIIEKALADKIFFSLLILSLPIVYITGASCLLLGISIGKWVLPIALFLLTGSVILLHREENILSFFIYLIIFLLLFGLCAFISSQFYDIYHDSRVYHAKAVLDLLDGINPYHNPSNWHNFHYPAGHWVISTSLITWTKSFEANFSLTYVASLVAWFASWRFLYSLKTLSQFWRISLSLLLSLNPITIRFYFSHHVDGFLVSILLSAFMLMLLLSQEKEEKQRFLYGLYTLVLVILLINVKFTGLAYGGVLGITALLYAWMKKTPRCQILHLIGIGAGGFILGTVVFGFFPYTTNAIKDKHPFSSAFVIDKQGIKRDRIEHFFSDSFNQRSRYEKVWISLFSKPLKKGVSVPEPFPPFAVGNLFDYFLLGFDLLLTGRSVSKPLPSFDNGNLFHSFRFGFGSLFSGTLLLCLTLVFFIRDRCAWVLLGGIICSIFITSVSFDFRLTPQHWWVPIFVITFLILPYKQQERKRRKPPQIMLIVIFVCMLCISGYNLIGQFLRHLVISQSVKELIKEEGWYGTPDISLKNDLRQSMYRYYKSGLSNLNIPIREFCPLSAKQKKPFNYGIILCRLSK